MNTATDPRGAATVSDEHLWRSSVEGDRDAFGRIVERYQNLVCSLAYSACGNLSRSEDLAQETFLSAWQHLKELREPSSLKSWLCGIARRVAANAARREARRGGPAVPLDDAGRPEPAAASDPLSETVSAEEEALMWGALVALPESYREPLVLFYRQGRSVAEVAVSLEIAEDTVKQRLSRGRTMIRGEINRRIESALTRSVPSVGFTVAVLGSLPAVTPPSASAAVLAAAAGGKGGGAVKGVLAGLGKMAFIGPVIGLGVGLLSTRAAASTARSEQERRFIVRYARRVVIFCWLMSIGLAITLSGADKVYPASALGIVLGVLAWVATLVGVIWWTSSNLNREVARIRLATGTDDSRYAGTRLGLDLGAGGPFEYRSRHSLLGLPLVHVATGGSDAGSFRARRALGWIALGDVAMSPLFAAGALAVAPVALGAVTVGALSLSLWGAALGFLAFGSVALGWHAFGLGALGWSSARGGAAVARDFALGELATANEANTDVARAWFDAQWFSAPVEWFAWNVHWLILLAVAVALWRLWRRARVVRRGEQDR